MRALASCSIVALAALAAAALRTADTPARGADPAPNGTYKLVALDPFNETELLLLDVSEQNGRLRATLKDAAPFPQPPQVTRVVSQGGTLTVVSEIGNTELTFQGKPGPSGAYLGTLNVPGRHIPSRLEPTKAEKVAPSGQQVPPALRAYFEAKNDADVKSQVKRFADLVGKKPGDPTLAAVYADLIGQAGAAGLSGQEVRQVVDQWVEGARPYGDAYAADIRAQALKALTGQKAYAPLTLELATEAEKALGADAALEAQGAVTRALAVAARDAGKADLADQAEDRLKTIDAKLDEEYHKKVPPFKPEPSAAAKARKSDRVVLLELFTGAQCPPCVAADVAFDALGQTYSPKELVTLQYHLHIPGPDPLTGPDSVKRSEYYPDLGGTPATYFDGKALAPGGGPMPRSKVKYDEYRKIIDDALEGPSGATIDLKATREGDSVAITARAEAKPGKGDGSKLRLRLALVEEQVRYTGGNGLRFHHHVVRALPGGPDGTELKDRSGKAEVRLKLSDLRQAQERYLSDFSKENGPFPAALPPVAPGKLAVVAFVQDDGDKSVLNAAMVPLGEAK
jgi:hypothetical protein